MSGTYELVTECEVKKAGYWAKIERDEYAAILTERLVNKGFHILPKYFAYLESRITCLFREARKKANHFCSTINPRDSFMFS